MRKSGVPVLLVIWLVVGAVVAGQRGYFSGEEQTCASLGTALVTIVAGPLNLIGLNPAIECPPIPQSPDSTD